MSNFDELKNSIAKRMNDVINPPKDQIKTPHNRLWIALLAFNAIFLPLDIATGITVGIVTRWYYGFFVLGAELPARFKHWRISLYLQQSHPLGLFLSDKK